MQNKKQELAKLKRRYLNLMYRITKSRLAGDDPPNELMKEFADIERTVKYKPKLGGRKRKGPV
jgi:hypothetical protein